MKKKIFKAVGIMSGTSMDGVDLSLIKTDGYDYFEHISDKFYEFSDELFKKLMFLRKNIKNKEDLKDKSNLVADTEKNFTLFNAQIVKNFLNKEHSSPDLIGFHGQTIFHSAKNRISKQIGNGKLLSQLTDCTVVNNFREQDLNNGGQGAPLTPIFHYLISKKINEKDKLNYPINIINIGGITNVTTILDNKEIEKEILAYDIGPGNCLIDEWVRNNSNKKFDNKGSFALSGKVDNLILNQAIDNFEISTIEESMDPNDFDISFVKGLNLENGCATLNKFTAYLISEGLKKINRKNKIEIKNFIICGGGRKNKLLIENINQNMNYKSLKIRNIDEFELNGDFIESQAFAYLAVKRYLNLPITFPNTTRCQKPSLGGQIIDNT